MSTLTFTYRQLFDHARVYKCVVDGDPVFPEIYTISHNSVRKAVVVATDDPDTEEIPRGLVEAICAQLGIKPP